MHHALRELIATALARPTGTVFHVLHMLPVDFFSTRFVKHNFQDEL